MESLQFLRCHSAPKYLLGPDALRQYLAINRIAQSGEIQLHGIVVVFGWQRIISDLAGLRVQAAERALVHRVEPDLPGMVELDAQESSWGVFLEFLDRVFGELERLRIELANEHLSEIRVPDVAFLIDQDVMRFGCRPYHIVFGNDGARVPTFRARQRLELVCPMVHRAQIYCGKIVRNFPIFLRLSGTSSIQHGLRLGRLTHPAGDHHAGGEVRAPLWAHAW